MINSLAAVMPMDSQRKVMGEFTTPRPLKLFGWLATAAVAAGMWVMQGK